MSSSRHSATTNERPVLDGITPHRVVQGVPYDLAGKRVVLTNWYYVQPGDLDRRDDEGRSVHVSANVADEDARHSRGNGGRP